MSAWLPIFQKYSQDTEPDWGAFSARFGDYFRCHPMDMKDLTGMDIQGILAKMRTGQSLGLDGWRMQELKALPLPVLDALAELFNLIEKCGRWPSILEQALITLIPKGQGAGPGDLRPISVMGAVYRVWAACRLKCLRTWQESWASSGQHAFRPGHSVEDVFWSIAVRVEAAVMSGEPFYGINFDYAKCFDLIPHNILMSLVEHLGIHGR
eukprot:12399023-Karenia_brevis.AAC.1